MESVFLRNGRYAAHVGLGLRPLLSYFGEEMFKIPRGSDIDEHADWLIRMIFETVDRAARLKEKHILGGLTSTLATDEFPAFLLLHHLPHFNRRFA